MNAEKPYVVAVVDDDSGFSEAMAWVLEQAGYAVRTYPDAAAFIGNHAIDALGCTLLDLVLEKESGLDVLKCARLKGFDAPFVMISGHGNIPVAIRAMQTGAFGFIEKPADNAEILSIVARACAAHRRQSQRYGRAYPALQAYERMTSREREVFWGMIDGLTTKEVAAALGISARTAEVHRAHIFDKASTGSLAGLHAMAYFLSAYRTVNT